jgi:hypothetical protein
MFVTLGFSIGDVGPCVLTIWLCVDWLFDLEAQTEAIMKATVNTVVNIRFGEECTASTRK